MAGKIYQKNGQIVTQGSKLSSGCPSGGCQFCTGATPTSVQAVLGGYTDDSCPSGNACSSLNGTYTLTQSGVNKCLWQFFPASNVCDESDIEILVNVQSTRVVGQVRFGAAGTISFSDNATGWDDCHAWSSLTLSHLSDTGTPPCHHGTFAITTL